MLHHRQRRIQALPSSPPRAQTEVRVLAIKEEVFVEASNFLEHRRRYIAADPLGNSTSSSTGKSTGAFPCPRCLLLPSRARSMPAESSRFSPYSRTCDAHIPASGRRSSAPTRASSQPRCATASSFNVARYRAPDARSPWLMAAPNPTLRLFSITRTSGAPLAPRHILTPHQAAPAVIHHDHFKIAPRLFPERFQAFQQSSIGSQRGDNYGRNQFRQRTILPAPTAPESRSAGGPLPPMSFLSFLSFLCLCSRCARTSSRLHKTGGKDRRRYRSHPVTFRRSATPSQLL
jgi:hypothetical protein